MALLQHETCTKGLAKFNNWINGVKSLDAEFRNGIESKKGDERIDNDDKLIMYQNEFWEAHMKCIESCNDTYMNINEYAAWKYMKKTFQKFWNFFVMVNLYNQDIYDDWPMTDLNSRKLTILIAICDVKQFRCGETIGPNETDESENQ